MNYDEPLHITYQLTAASVTSNASLLKVSGPKGLVGRVASISTVVTTGVTVAASLVEVGTVADEDAYATASIPISSADAVANTVVDNVTDGNEIPADSVVRIGTDGGATAGAANIFVTIAWF